MIDLDASASAALDAVTGHEAATALRSLLAHGLAGLALVAVALGIGRAGAGRAAAIARTAGLTAAALSFLQCALELILAGPVASAGDAGTAGALVDAVNHIDGLKMLALAALAAGGAATKLLPRWLGILGVVLAFSLVVSGTAYGLLIPALAPAAAPALLLLLVWIAGTGLALAKAAR